MYEMTVPGKPSVEVPAHLAGTVAVSLGRRLAWRILAIIIYGTLDVLLTLTPLLAFMYRVPVDTYNTLSMVTSVLILAWFAFVIVKFVRTGASPLMGLTGVRWVRYDTGVPAGCGPRQTPPAGLHRYAHLRCRFHHHLLRQHGRDEPDVVRPHAGYRPD